MAPSSSSSSSLLRGRLTLLLPFSLLLLHSLHRPSVAGPVSIEFLRPDFTAAYLDYVDNSGVFLESSSASFHLSIFSPDRQKSRYYVSVIHAATGAVVWTANPSAPLSYSSSAFSFTGSGLSVATSNSSRVRLTPSLPRPAALLRLLPSGELLLLDAANASLWSSFDYPTDTLLPGQLLPVSSSSSAVALSSSVSDSDLDPGDFRLVLTSSDAVLQWVPGSQLYWTLSTDLRATKDSNAAVAYMAVNTTGLYLLAADKKTVVYQMILSPSSDDLRFAKLDSSGRLTILGYSSNESLSTLDSDFVAPANDCDLPLKCGSLGLCSGGGNGSSCSCPTLFSSSAGGCSPADGSTLANPSMCNGGVETTTSSSPVNYIALDSSIGYFGNKFAVPTTSGGDGLECRNLCSANCSCVGYFYKNSSRSCYLIEGQLGSLSSGNSATTTAGYFKIIKSPTVDNNSSSSARYFAGILTPVIASFILLAVLGFIGFKQWKMRRHYGNGERKRAKSGSSGRQKSWPVASDFSEVEAGEDDEDFSIPGLPTRFSYAYLKDATNEFATLIGSGGFGSVYKGELSDKSVVAVKKVNNIGLQGKREFCTEIAVIGKIHHVNLVKLRGYCMEGAQRLLVYEYMNRGSLDRSLFGQGPPLEWQERVDIALGAARGLAYLHSGCEQKIIHCDVKPENILLHDHNQVKIADFGLVKLLSPQQSGLFTTMRGTRGYLAPEWLTNASISDKADVYSFGMVLLEIVRGRKNRSEESEPVWTGSSSSSSSSGRTTYFPSTALEMHELGRYEELADPRLEGRMTGPEIARVVKVALCCLHEEPALRPSMAAVAGMLEGTRPLPEPRVELLGSLKLYGRGLCGGDPNVRKGFPTAAGESALAGSTTGTSLPLLSYMSSQQLSGPR